MNSTTSRPKKSPSPKARRKNPVAATRQSAAKRQKKNAAFCRKPLRLRREFRAWPASLPTALERDTLLTPEWIAESAVQEAELFLKADLPDGFAERLAAKAHYLYPRRKHFRKGLNRPGNGGRATLYMFMRHWTAGWLKRERYALYKRLPWSYAQGQRLSLPPTSVPKHYPDAKQLVTEDCIRLQTK